MASKNKLLGSGKIDEVAEESVEIVFKRVWLYHKAVPAGLLITTQKQFNECTEAGWVDHPGKCNSLPGHEKLFKEVKSVKVKVE